MDRQQSDPDGEFFAAILADQKRGFFATLWLRLKAQLGNAEAQFTIGRTLMLGSGLHGEAAAKWFLLAAKSGHSGAQRSLEILLEARDRALVSSLTQEERDRRIAELEAEMKVTDDRIAKLVEPRELGD